MAITYFAYVPSGEAIEFTNAAVYPERCNTEDNVLATPPECIAEDVEFIVINGRREQIEPYVVRSLAGAIRRTCQLEARGGQVDCHAFAALLCGGNVQLANRAAFRASRKAIGYEDVAETSDHAHISRLLQPLQLADIDDSGVVSRAVHMVVPISEDGSLVAHKYGVLKVAVGDVATSARHYGTDYVASVLSMRFTAISGEHIVEYQAPETKTVVPVLTNGSHK